MRVGGVEVGGMPVAVDELRRGGRRCRRRRRRVVGGGGRDGPRLEAGQARGLVGVAPHPLPPPVVAGLEHVLVLRICTRICLCLIGFEGNYHFTNLTSNSFPSSLGRPRSGV